MVRPFDLLLTGYITSKPIRKLLVPECQNDADSSSCLKGTGNVGNEGDVM